MQEFFAGSNSPVGFYSYFNEIISQREAKKIICIKGGAGTGKSSAMKSFAKKMIDEGKNIEIFHCSSDPNSLDAVLVKDLAILLLDATAPHAIDPKTPGAVDEIFNMGDFWDSAAISHNKHKIIECNEEISATFARAFNYLSGAKDVNMDTANIYKQNSNIYGISSEFDKIRGIFEAYPMSKTPSPIRKLFMGAITPDGLVNYSHKTAEKCKKIIGINGDEYSYTGTFLQRIASLAQQRGFTVTSFYCPMLPNDKIEHLYIEEMGYYFTTCNKYHSIICDDVIDFSIYVNQNSIKHYSSQLQFNEELYVTLLNQAVKTLKSAKSIHDELEKFYIPNMDFESATTAFNKKINEII